MTTYLGDKAVGIGTVKAEIGVTGIVLHDDTLVGNGNTEPLGVNTANIVSQQTLANTVSVLNNDIQKTFENSVKKSGDTMTGILTIQTEEDNDPSTPPVGGLSFKSNASPDGFTNRMRQVANGFIAIEYLLNGKQYSNLVFGDQEIYIDNTENGTGNPVSLGTSGNPWDNVYAKKLNNGANITIPTLGGTLARIEDLQNATTTLNAGITGNAQAIQKTREDYIQADSEIHQILNNHAGELTTLRGNQASLGDQVSNIESKIPQSASDNNPLITKQQLLDEEMDIRDDYNGMISELQTQITAQAGELAKLDSEKIDKNQGTINAGKYLMVGDDGIVGLTDSGGGGGIADVIHDSTLTGKGTDDEPLGVNTEVIATKEDLESKQDKLTAGTNIIISDDNVISSTAQESFFRGRYKNWDSVPTNGLSYPNDIDGNHIPSNTDYIIIEDSSTVPGGQVDVQMTMETDAYLAFPNKKLETVINGITYNGTGIFDDGNIEVFCNADAGNYTAHWKTLKNSVEYQGKTYEAGSVFFKVIIRPEKNTTQNAKMSLGNPYTGSWRFSYRGAWDLDNKNGWKAEYQIEEIMPIADETQMGIAKLYTATGSNTDGTMTQKAITENTTRVIIRRWN